MGLISVICPYCFAEVALDDSEDYGVCIGCGFRIEIEKPVEVCPPEPVPEKKPKEGVLPKVDHVDESEVLKDEMFSYFDSGNLAKAHEIVKKLLSMDSTDADAWYMDGVCTLDRSEYPLETGSIKDAVASFTRFTDLTGLEVNIDGEAFRRYLKDAGKGDLQAQRRVGVMYSRGMGVEQSQDKAMEWFQKVYDHGCAIVRADMSDALRMMDSKHYTVPSFVDEIWDRMFEGTSFVSVTIPEPISRIGDRAFANCVNLEKVELPRTLRSIGSEAFYRCRSLTSMDIPITVRIIGDRAFYQSGMEEPPMTSPDPPKKEPVYKGPTSKPSGIPKPEPAVGTVPRPTPVSKPAPTPTPRPTPGSSPAPAPKPSPASTSAYKPKSKSDSILTKGDLLFFRLITSIFPLICIAVLLNTFGSFIGAGFCVAPALGILLRVSDDASAFSCFIDILLAICGIPLGFAFSVFHTLMTLCIIDGIALYMLHRLAGKLGAV
ncbi:MAG: leucine-rich repeat protein [Candidatus Methanomethylophilaceae archaeon]|nr:leucine-rich repeat protein [Candidatus Methanomethylophilaceae archaeon]MBR4697983.1 leucine-rich repeat protein [Candidatus Methanomethylophilaceae archaeon]